MEEVVAPVIASYRARLSEIVADHLEPEVKLRQLISLLAELYGKDAKMLEVYRELEEKRPDVYSDLSLMTSALADFFYIWRGDARAKCFDAAVLQGAVRGMCEFAERARAAPLSIHNEDSAPDSDWLETIFRMFATGRDLFGSVSGRGELVAIL